METRPVADAAALEQAVRQYQAELLRYAAGILNRPADAEDAVQTAFLKLWRSRDRLRPDTNLRALLYRITYHTALDMLRRTRREAAHTPPPVNESADPARRFDDDLRTALESLSPADRALVWGQVVEGLSCRELAAIHHRPEGYLRNRCSRAKRRLAALLTQEEGRNRHDNP